MRFATYFETYDETGSLEGGSPVLRVALLRAVAAIPVLLSLIAIVLVLQEMSPYDPARALAGERAPEEVVERIREELGLNDPLPVQYVNYIGRLARGDLGKSALSLRPVTIDLASFLPATLELVIVASIIALGLGLLLGVIGAQSRRGAGFIRFSMIGGASVPVFLTAFVCMIVFNRWLGWLPVTGRSAIADAPSGPTHFLLIDGLVIGRLDVAVDALRHLILPATILAIGPSVAIGRVLRSSMHRALRSDYVRTARAKGLTEARVVRKHALRNASGPALSMGGLQLASMFGIGIVVEVIFAWPGVGLYMARAIDRGDFTSVAAVTLLLGLLYVTANAAVDITQAIADPRLRK